MKIKTGKLYAILTGDIVNSSKLSPDKRQKLHYVMKDGSKAVRRAFEKDVPLDVDIFRGDSWQMLVFNPAKSLRIGLFYRAFLRAEMQSSNVDTRMSIAVGTIEFVPDDRVSGGDGQAYQYSGNALEKMMKASYMRFSLPGKEAEESLNIIVELVDALAKRWRDKQALAITGALQGWKQKTIGDLWEPPIAQQTVGRHLGRAGWYVLEKAIKFFEYSLQRL
ncbi:MAG: hypothetical protein JRJ77_12645 [Deltaproteobacteria bacterium]|nr:hypothetical protein [Deltaproteobacteria bacterium]MBW2342175.1 hypothetical protein [Deltaproteobacteria bacterium]